MKIAIVMTAYANDFDIVCRTVNILKNEKFYIHVDKKYEELYRKLVIEFQSQKERIHIFSQYSISWGNINHLYALLKGLDLALKDKQEYYYLISGNSIPIVNSLELKEYHKNNDKIICSNVTKVSESTGYTVRNYRTFNFLNNLNLKSNIGKFYFKVFRMIQYKIGIKRENFGCFKYDQLYKGVVWISFNSEVLSYINEIREKHDDSFLKSLSSTWLPEEIFFQTIFMNSPFKENIEESPVYQDFSYRNGSNPAFLDESDIPSIKKSNKIFARKINPNTLERLLRNIKKD